MKEYTYKTNVFIGANISGIYLMYWHIMFNRSYKGWMVVCPKYRTHLFSSSKEIDCFCN